MTDRNCGSIIGKEDLNDTLCSLGKSPVDGDLQSMVSGALWPIISTISHSADGKAEQRTHPEHLHLIW